ncbi:MAG: type VI secretion system tip protein VgrG [Deltaproteobacteria bacterium]|nr:type VI secretion system tip protein VgrG [Deltaproteobacteria bacterium]MBW2532714.1 type VI secretion system tip protein VgrG [Deltaproteobacteria bacterium]
MNRGSEADYVLGTSLGWSVFDVVRWHGVERLSSPFEYDVVLAQPATTGPVEIRDLVDKGATFRVATAGRWRTIHGIIGEAELIECTPTLLLYRVVLVPHLCRAHHRRRCRTFVDESLREIVATVLENRVPAHPAGLRGLPRLSHAPVAPMVTPSFTSFEEPTGRYRWALVDEKRVDEPRRMVVQYNETDFDFVSRLLEDEGLTYFFEHTERECVLTLTDRPGHAPLFERDEQHELVGMMQGGQTRGQEVVRAWRPARRLRAASVTMRDFAWRKSMTLLEASARVSRAAAEELEHFEFPARDEDEPRQPGAAPARYQLERYQAERELSEGLSTVRTHEPGYRFRMADRAGLRPDAELLLVGVETYAAQLHPEGTVLDAELFGFQGSDPSRGAFHEARFQSVPADVPYRPRRSTPAPRIDGVQTAIVTAEEAGEDKPRMSLHSDDFGRVRVRFPWDQRPEDGTPSSKLIRVSQPWAGNGYGALYVPRVGHEVLVAFERGDPNRPIIIGRVYDGNNVPPYDEFNSTKTTVKSQSVDRNEGPKEGYNEFRFDDEFDKEQIFLHAQRNLDEEVLADHTTTVGGDQTNSVAGSQSNSVGGDRSNTVMGSETVDVTGPRTTNFHATEDHTVDSDRTTVIKATDDLTAKVRTTLVETTDKLHVGATRTVTVDGNHTVRTNANYHSDACANHTFGSTNMYITQSGEFQVNASNLWLNIGGTHLTMGGGKVVLTNGAGATISMVGGLIVVTSGTVVSMAGDHSLGSSGEFHVNAGGNVNVKGAEIKLND